MKKKYQYAIMQGRLLPRFNNRYQAFPLNYWKGEFLIAKEMGFDFDEFIFDYTDFQSNPLFSSSGIKEISKVVKESRVVAGAKFYSENRSLIERVSSKYGVDPFVIVTIAGVESNYGVHHSQYSVFNALYSQIHEIPRRSKWATRELAEFIKYCYNDKLDPQEIGGSYAGAFGYGQFIPSSFTRYSVDFNENGVREPYSWPDVLGSIANYLRMNGYKKNSNDYKKGGDIYKSVYAYNHADNYVMAVLELTERIRERCTGSRKYYPSTITDFDRKRVRMYKSKGWAPDKTINMDAWVE